MSVTTSASNVALGGSFTFTATVSGPANGATPTGTGTWSVSGVSGISCTTTSGPTATASANSVTYSCAVLASTAGIYLPVFTFNGDANYSATAPTSGYTTTVAKATPTVGVVAAAASAGLGSTITFTATVTGPANAIAPTALGSWSITGVSGVTSCTTTTGPVGASNISTYTCSVVATRAGSYGDSSSNGGAHSCTS